jgi:FdhE protein
MINRYDTEIEHYARELPHYQELLAFHKRLLAFQAELAAKVKPGLQVTPERAREKWQAGKFLLADERLFIDPALFRGAMSELRPLLPAGKEAQTALDRLLASRFLEPENLGDLLAGMTADKESRVRELARETASEADVILFLFDIVLSPFYARAAMAFSPKAGSTQRVFDHRIWNRGFCPICGSEPHMARLLQDGGLRVLECSLCRTEWIFARLACPFCGNDAPDKLRYFQVNADRVHRVYCCEVCKRYIKTADERMLGREAVLVVENVVTSHLDLVAEGEGYH